MFCIITLHSVAFHSFEWLHRVWPKPALLSVVVVTRVWEWRKFIRNAYIFCGLFVVAFAIRGNYDYDKQLHAPAMGCSTRLRYDEVDEKNGWEKEKLQSRNSASNDRVKMAIDRWWCRLVSLRNMFACQVEEPKIASKRLHMMSHRRQRYTSNIKYSVEDEHFISEMKNGIVVAGNIRHQAATNRHHSYTHTRK